MSVTDDKTQRYSLAPVDRTGVMFGLSGVQVVLLLSALVGASMSLVSGRSMLWSVAWFISVVCFAVLPVAGIPLVQQVPTVIRFIRTRPATKRSWIAAVPLLEVTAPSAPSLGTTTTPPKRSQIVLPKAMERQELLAVDPSRLAFYGRTAPIGIVWDRACGTVACTMRVAGSGFFLADAGEQDRMLAGWGEALAAFARRSSPVVQIRWSEWAAPAPAAEHRNWILDNLSPQPNQGAVDSYEDLVSNAGPLGTRHEILITVVVSMKQLIQLKSRRTGNRVEACIEAAITHTRLFGERLESCGLMVSGPLTPGELGQAIRSRLDPACIPVMDALSKTIGERTGVVSPKNLGPLSARNEWTYFQTDGCFHQAYVVSEWPLTPVPASWLRPLLTTESDEPRLFTTFLEPIGSKASRLAINKSLAKIESDVEQKQKAGFRIGAAQKRQQRAIETKEEELVSGHPEFGYAAVVIVSGRTLDSLARNAEQVTQAAGQAGIELRALHGRHDQAVCASLPLARSLVEKKWW
jgi:hypothetical protein